jgi:hypothetical protein
MQVYSQSPEYQQAHRVRTGIYERTNPEKKNAQSAVKYAIRTGKLVRQPCEVCGEPAQAHHDDYSRPLDVKWLCQHHHIAHHKTMHLAGFSDPCDGPMDRFVRADTLVDVVAPQTFAVRPLPKPKAK